MKNWIQEKCFGFLIKHSILGRTFIFFAVDILILIVLDYIGFLGLTQWQIFVIGLPAGVIALIITKEFYARALEYQGKGERATKTAILNIALGREYIDPFKDRTVDELETKAKHELEHKCFQVFWMVVNYLERDLTTDEANAILAESITEGCFLVAQDMAVSLGRKLSREEYEKMYISFHEKIIPKICDMRKSLARDLTFIDIASCGNYHSIERRFSCKNDWVDLVECLQYLAKDEEVFFLVNKRNTGGRYTFAKKFGLFLPLTVLRFLLK